MRVRMLWLLGLALMLFATCSKYNLEFQGDLSSYYDESQLDSLIVGFFCHGGIAVSESTINPEVTKRFEEDFPSAYKPAWYLYKDMSGVIFQMDHKIYKVIYEHWIHSNRSRVEMLTYAIHCLKTEIPDNISNANREKYGSAWLIQDGYKIHTAYLIIYELEIETEDNNMTVFFNNNGDFLYSCDN